MELGARRLRSGDDDGGFYIVMEDPEGNEFCLA
jgi:predicted enzyme related to lactoylglutathione lyase